MAKYLLLKHYRGHTASVNDVPMDRVGARRRWEAAHPVLPLRDFADRLVGHRRSFVDEQALSPDGFWVRSD